MFSKYTPREFDLPDNPRLEYGLGRYELGVGERGGEDGRHEALDSTYLDFSPQDDVSITRISETKNSAKLIRSKITDIANFEFGGLAHERMTVVSR